jgi:hypothetical protein
MTEFGIKLELHEERGLIEEAFMRMRKSGNTRLSTGCSVQTNNRGSMKANMALIKGPLL